MAGDNSKCGHSSSLPQEPASRYFGGSPLADVSSGLVAIPHCVLLSEPVKDEVESAAYIIVPQLITLSDISQLYLLSYANAPIF
jgi:hypothetical protein